MKSHRLLVPGGVGRGVGQHEVEGGGDDGGHTKTPPCGKHERLSGVPTHGAQYGRLVNILRARDWRLVSLKCS